MCESLFSVFPLTERTDFWETATNKGMTERESERQRETEKERARDREREKERQRERERIKEKVEGDEEDIGTTLCPTEDVDVCVLAAKRANLESSLLAHKQTD